MRPVHPPQLAADPHAAFATLRDAGPVHRVRTPDGGEAWLLTRYADVAAGLADGRLSLDRCHSAGQWSGFDLPAALDDNLLNMDPPDHTRIRRLAAPAFSRPRLAGFAESFRAQARQLVADLPRGAGVDVVEELAWPFATHAICAVLGVPTTERGDFRSWSRALLTPDPSDPGQARTAVGQIQRYLTDLVAEKRAHPGSDPLSAAVAAHDAEGRLSTTELVSLALLLLLAGTENTVNLIGTVTLSLLRQAELLTWLRTNPGSTSDLVEEIVRQDGPAAVSIRRFARETFRIGDAVIEPGDTVLLGITSANHDENVFDGARRIDPDRTSLSQHLGFGRGPHYCLGAELARIEVRYVVEALFDDAVTVSLAQPVDELMWRPSFRTRGLVRLPVVLR